MSWIRTCVAAFALCSLFSLPAPAADTFKRGDQIEVLYLGEWRKAAVVNTDKQGRVLADYKFGAFDKQGVFKATEVRFAYESGALARGRNWSDKAGKFKEKAALIALDAESVTLRKADMSEVSFAIKDLSDTDQRYLKTLEKSASALPVGPPKLPATENFESGQFASWSIASFTGGTDRVGLSPDPLPPHMKLKQGGVGFPSEGFFDKLTAVFAVGGETPMLLASLEGWKEGNSQPPRILWASLDKQQIVGRQMLPFGETVLDYHQPSKRLVTISTDNKDKALTMWEVAPTDKQVKPIARWRADSGEGGLHRAWARIIDGNLVLQRYKKQEYVLWDVAAKGVKFRTTQESFFAPAAVLSGGRKYLFLPEDKGVRVLEAATGKLVSTLPTSSSASGVAVSDDGRMAAVLGASTLSVFDLASASSAAQVFQAEAIGTPFSADLYWLGSQRVIADSGRAGGQVLFSLANNIALWNYQFDHDAISDMWGQRVREVVDGHLVYGATVNSGGTKGLAVGAVQLPGPGVDQAEASLQLDSLMIIKSGTPVSVVVQAGENDARVRAALEAEVKKNGWALAPSSNVVLSAEMKQGPSQTVEYRFGGFGPGASTQSATVAPFISSAKIMIGDKIAWQSGTSTGAPPIIMLKQGQTVQAEIDSWQKPNVAFFEKLDIPARILDPDKRNGLGKTQVTNRGLITGK